MSSSLRIWLWRALVILSGGLLVFTYFMEWWKTDVLSVIGGKVAIHPWGLYENISAKGYGEFVSGITVPGWMPPVLWIYFGLIIIALLLGAWLKDKHLGLFGKKFNISRWLVGIVGFSYLVVLAIAALYASMRMQEFGMVLVGKSYISAGFYMAETWVDSNLQIGYYLGLASGVILIILAILRNKIIGKS